MSAIHKPTLKFNLLFYFGFLIYAIVLIILMPDRIPTRFDSLGNPIQWTDDKLPSMILIMAISSFTFWQIYLFQRFILNDPDSSLLNVPHKKLYLQLPQNEKVDVLIRANRMLGIINTLVLLTFTLIITLTYLSAVNPSELSVLITRYSMVTVISLVIIVPLAEAFALNAMVKERLREHGLLER